MERKRNGGITLIALVITIIVLLILAGVVIATLTGENGILNQVTGAKKQNNKATALEQVQTEVMGSYDTNGTIDIAKLNENLGHIKNIGGLPISQLPATVKVDEYEVTINGNGNTVIWQEENRTIAEIKPGEGQNISFVSENTRIKDDKGNQVVIPEGFGIAKDSATIVTDGVVIEDRDGNQFVWIPVGTITKNDGTTAEIKLNRYIFAEDGTPSDYKGGDTEDTEENHNSSYKNTIAKDIKEFKISVNNNHGYYLARYEASKNASTGKLESKSATVWNNITQPDAAIACRKMYSSSNFTSDLINSYAWDTAIVFIQTFSGDIDYSRQNTLNTILANTGENGDEKCHIHDMASNTMEWTTETFSDSRNPCIIRGSSYIYMDDYTSSRQSSKNIGNVYTAFRSLLYL